MYHSFSAASGVPCAGPWSKQPPRVRHHQAVSSPARLLCWGSTGVVRGRGSGGGCSARSGPEVVTYVGVRLKVVIIASPAPLCGHQLQCTDGGGAVAAHAPCLRMRSLPHCWPGSRYTEWRTIPWLAGPPSVPSGHPGTAGGGRPGWAGRVEEAGALAWSLDARLHIGRGNVGPR